MQNVAGLLDTTIGKKALMALTGLVLLGFIVGHMLGNLQIYLGSEALNGYAHKLQSMGPLLWAVRFIIASSMIVHVWMVIVLYARSQAARPIGYRCQQSIASNYASRTMWLTGVLLLLFALYHLAHFTYPGVPMGDYQHDSHGQVYRNVIQGFQIPWVVAVYCAAQLALGFHLFHGGFSLVQTLGCETARFRQWAKTMARALACFVVLGNVSIPVAVLAGMVR